MAAIVDRAVESIRSSRDVRLQRSGDVIGGRLWDLRFLDDRVDEYGHGGICGGTRPRRPGGGESTGVRPTMTTSPRALCPPTT